ncbi:unnamed protein product [Onchocerca flexuosa]|uniref:Ovule protein n=1 Tax=Onchocerca flexuosa TaxID=387005 RepID=A0A183HQ49_9BILA|nr:unnamed protein product [Onchocerca flexuosa]
MRWCFSGGHVSPPPPPQRKLVNPSISLPNTTAGSSSSSNEVTSNDEDHRWLKRAEKSDPFIMGTTNRPSIAPKPKFDDRNISTSLIDDKESLRGLQKSSEINDSDDCVESVSRRVRKIE